MTTNYLTSSGCQQFTITIASGATTGTATINATGSGAFIVYGGINPSVTTNAAEGFASLTLTNSTTVTANRNTGTAGTVVIRGCVVDGDTTNLIKSVQYGTATVAATATTGTASISAVTNNNTVIHYLGCSAANATYTMAKQFAQLSLSGTTVTATIGAADATYALVVAFVAIEFQGGVLNQAVQQISASSASSVTSWTAAVNTVVTNNTFVFYAGQTCSVSIGVNNTALFRGALTSTTVLTAYVNTAAAYAKTYGCCVVEFAAGILESAVQRGTTTLTGVVSNTTATTNVSASNSFMNYLGNTSNVAGVAMNNACGNGYFSDAFVAILKNSSSNNITAGWEIVEFPPYVPGSGPYFIQDAASAPPSSSSYSTLAVQYQSQNCTAGSTLVCAVTFGASVTPTCSDNVNGSWQAGPTHYDSGYAQGLATFYFPNNASATKLTVTVNFGSSTAYVGMIISEYGGVNTSQPDVAGAINEQAAPATTADAITSGTITTSTNGDLIYGVCNKVGGNDPKTVHGTGFNSRGSIYIDMFTEDKIQTTAGSGTAATFTDSQAGGATYITAIMAFKPKTSAPATMQTHRHGAFG